MIAMMTLITMTTIKVPHDKDHNKNNNNESDNNTNK